MFVIGWSWQQSGAKKDADLINGRGSGGDRWT